jgi:hypothetical protein
MTPKILGGEETMPKAWGGEEMGAWVSSHVEPERARVASRVEPECAAGVSDPTCRRWRAR